VMQYIYGKYGRERAALTATVITYRPKSALRDVGKALGMDLAQVDRLAGSLAWWDNRDALAQRLRETGFDPENPVVMRVLAITKQVLGFPRHLSQHTGGFVISRDRLSRLVGIENAAMEQRTVIQWEKNDLESLKLMKVDCLALGMLSAIRRALDLVSDYRGKKLSLYDLPEGDKQVYRMVQKADTIGVFQIESRAQMSMLPRLKPKNFYDLVVQISIVRPGPIVGGMVHPYLRRREHPEEVDYPSPQIKAVLERTLGVPIFQEQVMQLAMVAGGFSAGEADQLRRSMAAWRRSDRIQQFRERLVSGMLKNGYSEDYAERLFKQIEGFGEYGFPESHAASFALLAYASAWLKCHEPAAFTCALLNSQPMGFYAPAQLIQDARKHGVEVRPVDATVSDWDCSLERRDDGEPALRLGLRQIKGMPQAAVERIVAARKDGPSASIQQLAERAALGNRELKCLAAGSALQSFAAHRRQAYWQVQGIETPPPVLHGAKIEESELALPAPSEGEDLVADYRSLGFTLGRHPLCLLRSRLVRWRAVPAAQLAGLNDGRHVKAAGLVINRQRPGTASGVIFLTLEDETGMINVVVWNDLAKRQRRELLGARLLGVSGVLERQGGVLHLIARRLTDHTPLLGRLITHSRDFH
nr:error-prone DNA polymerase [Burkholderiales bacterium]